MIYIIRYQANKSSSEILFKLSNAKTRKTFYKGEKALKITFYFLALTIAVVFVLTAYILPYTKSSRYAYDFCNIVLLPAVLMVATF